jgi:hypothetical protein
MAQNRRRNIFINGMALLLIVACAIPGTVSPAVSTADPNALMTIIAATAVSAATQTASSLVEPVAQPTSTETPLPAATNTPQISSAGTSLLVLEDGTTQFTDHTAGIRLVVPAGWLSLRPNEAEYYKAWESPQVSDPAFADELSELQTMDIAIFRLDALDIRPDHVLYGEISNLAVVFQQDDTRTLEEAAEDDLVPSPFTDYELISSGFEETADGMPIFVSEKKWVALSGTDELYTTYYRSVSFKLPSGLVALDLITPLDLKDVVLADFEQFVASLVLIP